jgi:Carboxypeptidase regulatory-like domain
MQRTNKCSSQLILAVLLAGVMAQAQTDATQEQKPAVVSGVVTNSLTGEPLAHAHVRLDLFTQQKGSRYGAITAVDGRFAIKAIAAGHYQLTVERRGFGALAGEEENRKNLDLKAGEQITDLVLRMVPDAVISGRVLDANGVPMEQVAVEAVAGRTYSTLTDDRGEFRIGGLRPGRYLVKAMSDPPPLPPEVRTDGTVAVNYGLTYYPSSPTARSAVPVQAQAGQETGRIEIKLLRAPILHLSGILSNAPKSANLSVTLDSGNRQRTYPVGADLKFVVWRRPPGHYQLFAQLLDRNGALRTAPVEINLTTSSIEGINLIFTKLFELNGRVQIEGGAPIEAHGDGGLPTLELQPLGSMRDVDQEETLPLDGSFTMTDVSPGRYHVLLQNMAPNLYVKSVSLGETEFPGVIVDLRSGAAGAKLVVLLGTDGAGITGVVRDPKGPVAGSEVALFFDDEYGFDQAGAATTGVDGTYAFHGIAPGKYRVLAYDSKNAGRTWSSDSLALYDSVTERIEVSSGDKVAQDLKLLR